MVELFLAQHPWWTLVIGMALSIIPVTVFGLVLVVTVFGPGTDRDTDHVVDDDRPVRWPAVPRAVGCTWLGDLEEFERRLDACGRQLRHLHQSYLKVTGYTGTRRGDRRHQLQELARQLRRCVTQVRLMEAHALNAGRDDGGHSRDGGGRRDADPFSGGAGADGPDACALFPEPATSSGGGLPTATH